MAYDTGDLVRCSASFKDYTGTLIDPENVFFKLKDPSGGSALYQYGVNSELVRSDTGVYYVDVNASAPGGWWYRFYSTGSGQAAAEGLFTVKQSMV